MALIFQDFQQLTARSTVAKLVNHPGWLHSFPGLATARNILCFGDFVALNHLHFAPTSSAISRVSAILSHLTAEPPALLTRHGISRHSTQS